MGLVASCVCMWIRHVLCAVLILRTIQVQVESWGFSMYFHVDILCPLPRAKQQDEAKRKARSSKYSGVKKEVRV